MGKDPTDWLDMKLIECNTWPFLEEMEFYHCDSQSRRSGREEEDMHV